MITIDELITELTKLRGSVGGDVQVRIVDPYSDEDEVFDVDTDQPLVTTPSCVLVQLGDRIVGPFGEGEL
jgi:hypothetical protein